MPLVTFSVGRNADNENFVAMGPFTVGPNNGNVGYFYSPGSYNSVSSYGNGPGGTALRYSGNTFVGLDDNQGEYDEDGDPQFDNDFNDLTVQITSGNAIFTGGSLYVYYDPVTIYNFYATPNPQNSTSGTPQYSTTLRWSSVNGTSATITSSAGESWGVGTSGSRPINNLPQSTAGSNSPRSRSYSLSVSNPNSSKSASTSVSVRNDNTPSNGWTTSFTNLNPNTLYTLTIATLSGVDMPTTISAAGSGNFVGNGGSFSGSRNFTNGQSIQLRTTSLPFNTSMSGVGSNATYGNTNSKTVTVNYPGGSKSITITTKAPVVKETFDYADNKNKYPYEDIDLITNTPLEFTTSAQITADDIEIAQEVKLDKPDAQVSINNGTWQNVREI